MNLCLGFQFISDYVLYEASECVVGMLNMWPRLASFPRKNLVKARLRSAGSTAVVYI